MDDFGMVIRRLREKKGVGLRQAAKDINVSPSYLSKIEQGVVEPPAQDVIRRLATYYDVHPESLIIHAPKRYDSIIRNTAEKPNKAELFALYRMVQDVDEDLLYELLIEVYRKTGKTQEKLEFDLKALRLEFLRLPKNQEGLFAYQARPRFLSKQHLEHMAKQQLEANGIDLVKYVPPTPIEAVVENAPQIQLSLTDKWDPQGAKAEPKVLGLTRFLKRDPSKAEIMISSRLFESTLPTMRARLHFTLAHEYFHAIEHLPKLGFNKTVLQRANVLLPELSPSLRVRPSIRKRKLDKWLGCDSGPRRLVTPEDWREWQANYFASALLMPRTPLIAEFEERFGVEQLQHPDDMSIREYAFDAATTLITPEFICDDSLCSLFDVSAQAMSIRLMQLELVV